MKHVTIQQALQHVANNPELLTDEIISLPVHELVSRTLFEIANDVHMGNSRSMSRANKARDLIFLRLVGRRRAGSHPATRKQHAIRFVDLTGALEK